MATPEELGFPQGTQEPQPGATLNAADYTTIFNSLTAKDGWLNTQYSDINVEYV